MHDMQASRAISRLVTSALIGVAVLAIAGLAAVILTYRGADHATAELVAGAVASHQRALELAVAEKNMEIDITGIQEQAEDAGDVGGTPAFADDVKEDYDGVRKSAEDFAADAAEARAVAAAFGDSATMQTIDSMDSAVPALRDVALRMAAAYVVKGRDAGNIEMKPFDAEVERLKGLTATVRNSVAAIVARAASQMDAANAERAQAESTSLLVGGLVGLLLAAALGGIVVLFQKKLLVPIRRMTQIMARLAQHDLAAEVEGAGRKDEIGAMAAALQVFKTSLIEGDRRKAEQEDERRRADARSRKLEELSHGFETRVGSIVQTVAAQATQMQASAQSMSVTAQETTKQAGAVAAASEESASNVQTVASAAEELSSSIAEIARQVGHSSRIASNAVTEAGTANAMVNSLAGASQKIGEIVALINDIADQTNLLALNATIEAARAGEAGKGFAVVASEVKNLATQTSKATEDIRAQISGVQSATQDAVRAIDSIGGTIGEINQIVTTIAAAVEQQGAATKEIARNVEETAKGTREVSANIAGVTHAANGTGEAAGQVLGVARALSGQSADLRKYVVEFLADVKAA
ncbi:MAG TPA: HAMP domain-containing methyl-accepting chemotaxis protein [Rhizomicrobium sp.]|jgi:methyl-accepting chemotaxis protein|nr:HAMP domain-containing methyl-accepting chemotaxis protein [Rhizomicrobium sp.]